MIRFILMLTFVYAMFTDLYGQWEVLNEGIKGWPNDLDFVDEHVGWMTGYNTLLKTEDGGETWMRIPSDENLEFEKVDFVTDSIGWVVIYSQIDGKRFIAKTEDGGKTWVVSNRLPSDYNARGISSVSDSVVYFAGQVARGSCGGWILKTVDGGANWLDVTPPSPLNLINLNSVNFYDAERGFAAGTCNDRITVFTTFDGGTTWREKTSNQFASIQEIRVIHDSTTYFLARKDRDHFLCITRDAFNTWTIQTHSTSPISSLFVQDDHTIFALMQDSLSTNVMKSTDSGTSWETKQSMGWQGIYRLYFTPSNNGFILFGSPFSAGLYRSTDGGEKWTLDRISYPFKDVFFVDERNGFIVGGGQGGGHTSIGDMFVTDDGGLSWQRIFGSAGGFLYGFSGGIMRSCMFLNEETGFALGGQTIYKTSDMGANWIESYRDNLDSTGYQFRASDISSLNEYVVWAVGAGSWSDDSSGAAILGTDDAGETWDLLWKYPADEDAYYNLNSIHVVNTTAWAVGESGLIVKSTGHDSFKIIERITDLPLRDIFFSDEQHGWIAGGYFDQDTEYLILLRTTDGGLNWQEVRDLNFQINDMFFADSLHGWAVGQDTTWHGLILETSDGGENWNLQVGGLSGPLNALHFRDHYGWAVGYDGLVLRTDDGVSWVEQKTGDEYPSKYSLSQNYPNPFNLQTSIRYTVPLSGTRQNVTLEIFNLLGQKIRTLSHSTHFAGDYSIAWDGKDQHGNQMPSGIYLNRLTAGDFVQVKKMTLLR